MVPGNWPASDNLFRASTFDAMKALEAARPFRELESSLFSPNAYAILEQQRAIERYARGLVAYDTEAAVAKATLTEVSMQVDKFTAVPSATDLHAKLLETT